jgi:hypothetical protein
MGQTHKMLAAQTTTRQTAAINILQADDESGVFQIEWTDAGSGAFTINLEGRATPDAPWYQIEEFKEDSSDSHNDLASDTTIASVVVTFPQMRVNLSAITNGSISAWLVE